MGEEVELSEEELDNRSGGGRERQKGRMFGK